MKKKLLIIGAGGHGKVVADVAKSMNKYEEICFLDDNITKRFIYPILGKIEEAFKYVDTHDFFVAIGNHNVRQSIMESLNVDCATLIHANSIIGSNVKIGKGCVIMPGTVINAGTTIGNGVIVNTSSSVDHDCEINDFCHISVGAHVCGTVSIGTRTWMGAGATVINNINICNDCMIGAGAGVISDINEFGTHVGVPACKVK